MTPVHAALADQQLALVRRYQTTRDLRARDELVRSVSGLAFHAVSPYMRRAGLDVDDLLAEARLGLLEACDSYDEVQAQDADFAMWALWQARRRVRRAVRAAWAWCRVDSLDEPAYRDGDEATIDMLAVDATQEAEVVGAQAAAFVRAVVAASVRHNDRLGELARRRLLAERPETLAQVGVAIGVSKQYAQQLEAALYVRLARRLRGMRRAL
jgi:RNA polymerase sigma factor (sigma-70 family)